MRIDRDDRMHCEGCGVPISGRIPGLPDGAMRDGWHGPFYVVGTASAAPTVIAHRSGLDGHPDPDGDPCRTDLAE